MPKQVSGGVHAVGGTDFVPPAVVEVSLTRMAIGKGGEETVTHHAESAPMFGFAQVGKPGRRGSANAGKNSGVIRVRRAFGSEACD